LLPQLFSQNDLSIRLEDAETGEGLPFAHLCFENKNQGIKDFLVSNDEGLASYNVKGETVLAVSLMGYQTKVDTVFTGGKLTLKMEPLLFDMDEVVVTAQINPVKADNSIYKVSVINSLDIQQKAANDLSGVLRNELGFRVSQDVLGSKLSLNGLGGEHIKILVDGVPVIGRMAGNIDLSQLNMHNVDHIEIVEGPMSVMYGSNALGGAINIITKEEKRRSFQTMVHTYYESVGVYNGDLGVTMNKKQHSFNLTGGRNFFSGYPKNDDSRYRLWKPKEQYFTDFYYLFSNERSKLKLKGNYFYETILNRGSLIPPYFETALDSYFYTERYSGSLNYQYQLSDQSKIEFQNAYNSYSRIKNTWFNDLTLLEKTLVEDISQQDTSTFRNLMSRAVFSFQSLDERFGMMAGYDIQYEKGTGRRILDEEQAIGDFAGFVSLNYEAFSGFEIQPGFRYAYNTNYDAPLVPSFNIKYQYDEKLSLRASYVRGFRAPSLKELYLYFVDINHNIQPGPDLDAEYSHNFNLFGDYEFDIDKHYFGVETGLFYNSIENRIDLAITDTINNVYSYLNIDGYKTRGGNLKFNYRLHPRFTLIIGGSVTNHYVFKELDSGDLEDQANSYDFMLNAEYNLFRKNFSWGIYYKYTGRYPQFEVFDEEIRFGSIDPYHMLDFTINKTFLQNHLQIGTGVKNILDVTTVSRSGNSGGVHSGGSGSIPAGWGRTFFIRLNYTFVKR